MGRGESARHVPCVALRDFGIRRHPLLRLAQGPVVFRHREHMQRLHDSAKIYRFPVSQSIDELMELVVT